ncbi:protein kinase domain-containing protein [Aquisphaera insulae]|uniref:serine/threonine-protein kinase n=1 Tax=Aquisphaera insulae TaxID=2712864 RepID=UPI0013EA5B56|nr:serine/threonine-protein kinase [Aquisphaera insulae]
MPSDTLADRLGELLDRWESRRDEGLEATPEELCSDCPELVEPLRVRIAALRAMEGLLRVSDGSTTAPHGGEASRPAGTGAGGTARSEAHFGELRFHAAGGLGEVYLARHEDLSRDVALKFIRRDAPAAAESERRFRREAEITARLEHPGIVPVYGLGADSEGRPCYAMRFIRGRSLREAIAAFHEGKGQDADLGERKRAFRGLIGRFRSVCATIAYAHSRNVLHRDIKPANIMLGEYEETLVVDWGLAREMSLDDPDNPARAGSHARCPETRGSVGTPGFMSPEQQAGNWARVGPASDVYSLGATLYCLVTGRTPFHGMAFGELLHRVERGEFPAPRQVSPTVPRALEAICLKAMALAPEDRYPTATALAEDLDRWLADEPVTAWREPWTTRTRRWASRHRTSLAAGSASLIVAAVALVVGWAWLSRREAVRAERLGREVDSALSQADASAGRAREASDPVAWDSAVAAASRAVALLQTGPAPGPYSRKATETLAALESERARFVAERDRRDRDRRMTAEIESAMMEPAKVEGGKNSYESAVEAFRRAFRNYGLDVDSLPPEEAAARVRCSAISRDLVAGLLEWARLSGEADDGPLSRIARDGDPSRGKTVKRIQVRRDKDGVDYGSQMSYASEATRRIAASSLLKRSEQLRGEGRIDDAIEALRGDQWYHPLNFWVWYELTVLYLDRRGPGDVENAARLATGLIAMRPDSPLAYTILGRTLSAAGDHEAAIRAHRQATGLQPRFALASHDLGRALYRAGRLDEAEPHLRRSIEQGEEAARVLLGVVLADRGRYRESISPLTRALETAVDDATASLIHARLGFAHLMTGRDDEAARSYRTAIGLGFNQAPPPTPTGPARANETPVAPSQDDNEGRLTLRKCFEAARSVLTAAEGPVDGRRDGPGARARARGLAFGWLRIGLDACGGDLLSARPEVRETVRRALNQWQSHPDLAAIRDETRMADLSPAERAAYRHLWADVRAMAFDAAFPARPFAP